MAKQRVVCLAYIESREIIPGINDEQSFPPLLHLCNRNWLTIYLSSILNFVHYSGLNVKSALIFYKHIFLAKRNSF